MRVRIVFVVSWFRCYLHRRRVARLARLRFSLHKRVFPTCVFDDVVFPIVVLVSLAATIVAAVIAFSVMESTWLSSVVSLLVSSFLSSFSLGSSPSSLQPLSQLPS